MVGLVLASLAPGLAVNGPASAKSKVVFKVAMLGEGVDSLNPFVGIQSPSYEMWGLTYDYLVGYSMTDMSPAPALATKWTTSPDGKTWTFTVRKGVKFSDGVPLTAKDVAYTFNRVLHGKTEQASWISYLNGVTDITAPNPTTVVLKLKQPSATLPLLPIPIVPEHVWKNVSESDVKTYSAAPSNGQPVVGEGPFRLVEGTANGDTFKFEANPDYWGGRPHVDEVIFQFYKNDDAAIQAMIKGEVDFVEGITALEVKHLQGQAGVTAHNGNSPAFEEIAFNTGSVDTKTGKPIGDPNPAMLDPKFRHALGYAVNLPQLIQKVYQGAGLPGTTIVPPSYKAYHWEPPAGQKMTFNLAKAGQLLDAAGYKKGSDGLRTMPDGKPIGTLRLDGRSDSPTALKTMDYFKSWLSQLGIKAQVSAPSSNQLTDIILKGNFDAFAWGWYVEPDPDSMLSYMTCGQRGNWSDSWFCNKQYDALYHEQHVQIDQAKREAEVKKMQQILYQQSPYLVTAYDTIGEAVRSDHFACFVPQPNPGGVWIEQYGVYNYTHIKPASQAGNCESATGGGQLKEAVTATKGGSSSSIGLPFIIGGAVLLAAALAVFGGRQLRRRATVGDRE
ncbi:MAG TPA: ABC transporter substrate-binding protein [Jatrophihabitans sp.]|nr:ABC transporter substrate-binding protein [Jatrophihabitans sp.]